jgi:hypothetical protein
MGRGRKHLARYRWTTNDRVHALAFLVLIMLAFALGMYIGWMSAREENKEMMASPQVQAARPDH